LESKVCTFVKTFGVNFGAENGWKNYHEVYLLPRAFYLEMTAFGDDFLFWEIRFKEKHQLVLLGMLKRSCEKMILVNERILPSKSMHQELLFKRLN